MHFDRTSLGKLVSVIHRYGHCFFDHEFSDVEIGHGPRNFLAALYCREGISQDELSEYLMMDKTTTARAIKKLVDTGYVTRSREERDRRFYHLYLTDKGRALAPRIWETRKQWTETLSEGFSEEEEKLFYFYLERAANNAARFRDKGWSSSENMQTGNK